jgi:hypothetical protein
MPAGLVTSLGGGAAAVAASSTVAGLLPPSLPVREIRNLPKARPMCLLRLVCKLGGDGSCVTRFALGFRF